MKKRLKNEEFTLSVRKSLNMGGMEESKVEELPEKSSDEVGSEMWTEVYAPRSVQDLVGNQGVIDNLYEWLRDWDDVNVKGNKKSVNPKRG